MVTVTRMQWYRGWIFFVLPLYSQVPAHYEFNSDTGYSFSPATACWTSERFLSETSAITGIPEWHVLRAAVFSKIQDLPVGMSVGRIGTFFQNRTDLSFSVSKKSQTIAASLSLGMSNSFAEHYYSRWRPTMHLHTMTRLFKGKCWFSLDMKNLLPSESPSPGDALSLVLSTRVPVNSKFFTGAMAQWTRDDIPMLKWCNQIRWNKHLMHFLVLHLPQGLVETGVLIQVKRHRVRTSGVLFYSPGFHWSCGYSYCW